MMEVNQAIRTPHHQNYGTADPVPPQGIYGIMSPTDAIQTPGPSAPPVLDLDNISGYEGITIGNGEGKHFPPPPGMGPGAEGKPQPTQTIWNIPAISEDVAKEAFIKYAKSKCCYSVAPAREMVFQDLKPFNTYRYRLETFTESRSSVWKTEPYKGEPVDSLLPIAPPLPWDITVEIPNVFKDNIAKIRVPHTSSVKGCPKCGCSGRTQCKKCYGRGRIPCWVCHGSGNRSTDGRCTHCFGTGHSMCQTCSSMGTTSCDDCGGRGQLLLYIELQVEWKNNISEYVADQRCGFPTELFKTVNGEKLFVDERYMVSPVLGFPDSAIDQASRNAIEQHQAQFTSTSRIVRQRQTIELIFLTKVEYEWKGKTFAFHVYGDENKVHTEDYPRKCCCTIL